MLVFFSAMIDDKTEELRFSDIYYGYRKQMLLVAERLLKNHEDAEDAVQIALLGIARNIKRLPPEEGCRLRTYVLTAARNAAFSILRHRNLQAELVDVDLAASSSDEDLFEALTRSEDYEALLRAVRRLDAPYREVLLMVYVYGKSVRETAAVLQRKVGTVRQQLRRGKEFVIQFCREEGICLAYEDCNSI